MVMTTPSWMVIGETNDRTTERSEAVTAGNEGRPGRGARGGVSRVETASLSLLIARHEGGGGMQDVVVGASLAGRAMRPTRAWLRRFRRRVPARRSRARPGGR